MRVESHGLLEHMRAMEEATASLREELRSDGDSQRGMNRVFLSDVHRTWYLTITLKRMANFLTDLLRSFPIDRCI